MLIDGSPVLAGSFTDPTMVLVAEELRAADNRVELDDRAESLGSRIKDARNERIPYILVAGEREAEACQIGVRNRREGELGAMTLDDLAKKMQSDVDNKIC